jgi:hypothetical protein
LFLQIRFHALKSNLARNFVLSQAGVRTVSGHAQVTTTHYLCYRRPERRRENDVRSRVSSSGESGGIFERGSKNFMSESKSKTKSVKAGTPAESRFVATAKKAMRKAQHTAARENARFGLPLIVTR